jgi:hypothetical protein
MAKNKELKAAKLPPLVDIVESFKDAMKAQNVKWKKMSYDETVRELSSFLAGFTASQEVGEQG